MDNFPIGELPEGEWLQLTRKGFTMPSSDAAADLITKLHLKRLVSYGRSAERQALLEEFEQAVQAFAAGHGLSLPLFERIDRITRFCDDVAFDFSFERSTEGAVQVFPRNDGEALATVHYRVDAGEIAVRHSTAARSAHAG